MDSRCLLSGATQIASTVGLGRGRALICSTRYAATHKGDRVKVAQSELDKLKRRYDSEIERLNAGLAQAADAAAQLARIDKKLRIIEAVEESR